MLRPAPNTFGSSLIVNLSPNNINRSLYIFFSIFFIRDDFDVFR